MVELCVGERVVFVGEGVLWPGFEGAGVVGVCVVGVGVVGEGVDRLGCGWDPPAQDRKTCVRASVHSSCQRIKKRDLHIYRGDPCNR